MEERFVINVVMDDSYSVSWPGYEWVVCDNETKAANLLKILFDEVEVEDAILAVKKEGIVDDGFVATIPKYTYWEDPTGAGKFLASHYAVVGCKFDTRELAEKFKTIMDRRLTWRRISDRGWA